LIWYRSMFLFFFFKAHQDDVSLLFLRCWPSVFIFASGLRGTGGLFPLPGADDRWTTFFFPSRGDVAFFFFFFFSLCVGSCIYFLLLSSRWSEPTRTFSCHKASPMCSFLSSPSRVRQRPNCNLPLFFFFFPLNEKAERAQLHPFFCVERDRLGSLCFVDTWSEFPLICSLAFSPRLLRREKFLRNPPSTAGKLGGGPSHSLRPVLPLSIRRNKPDLSLPPRDYQPQSEKQNTFPSSL